MEEHGVPLSLVVTGANLHDVTQLEEVLDSVIIKRPQVTDEAPQHLCADKGYTGRKATKIMVERNYTPHVKPIGEEVAAKREDPEYRARRWVVEACHSWFNRFRKILVRYEKKARNYLALLHLAAAIICWRKIDIIYG